MTYLAVQISALLKRNLYLTLAMAVLAVCPFFARSGYSVLAQTTASPPSQINPAARQLLDQAIQALGGTTFLTAKTLSTEGRAFSITDGVAQGFVKYQSDVEFPDKRRLSYGFNSKKGVTLINNGGKGWEIDRYGTIEQSDKRIQQWELANRYSLENLLRQRIHEPGMLIQNAGTDFVDNLPAQVIEILDVRQVRLKLYLNSQTHLPIRIAYQILNPQTHQWDEYADVYADYRDVEGVQTPMHVVRYLNGDRVSETFRLQARYNQTFPAGFFQPGH